MTEDIQFAIVGATYHRRNGTTAACLKRMFKFLQNQSYQNFKLFLIGDDYIPEQEFNTICSTFPQDKIYYKNYIGISYRNGVFTRRQNTWTSGGTQAKYIGIKQAIQEGFKYYLHIDDDDIWQTNHIQEHYLSIKKYPQVDFQFTISRYVGGQLPRRINISRIKNDGYNNLIPQPCNVVHSTWCINLETIGPQLLQLFEERIRTIANLRNKGPEPILGPMDARTLQLIEHNIRQGVWRAVFISKITCNKPSEGNIP